MTKKLTNSIIDRQNVLNNNYAISEIEKSIQFKGILFENEYKYIKTMVSNFYEVDERTIDRYIKGSYDELSKNRYEVLRGNRLKKFKLELISTSVNDIDVVNKTTILTIFNFRNN